MSGTPAERWSASQLPNGAASAAAREDCTSLLMRGMRSPWRSCHSAAMLTAAVRAVSSSSAQTVARS